MTLFLWDITDLSGSPYNLLTTELNVLASGSGTALGPEINNTANGYQSGRLHLHLASNSLVFTTASFLKVFFLPSLAGATYPTYTSGGSYRLAEQNYYAATIYLNPTTQSANVVDEYVDNVPMPQGKFKTVVVSVAGVTLPASGNTLDIIPTPSQY